MAQSPAADTVASRERRSRFVVVDVISLPGIIPPGGLTFGGYQPFYRPVKREDLTQVGIIPEREESMRKMGSRSILSLPRLDAVM